MTTTAPNISHSKAKEDVPSFFRFVPPCRYNFCCLPAHRLAGLRRLEEFNDSSFPAHCAGPEWAPRVMPIFFAPLCCFLSFPPLPFLLFSFSATPIEWAGGNGGLDKVGFDVASPFFWKVAKLFLVCSSTPSGVCGGNVNGGDCMIILTWDRSLLRIARAQRRH